MIFADLLEVLDPDPHPAAVNMAIDEVLLREAAGPVLRIYRWIRPSISLGYFGKIVEAERTWPGRDCVRRWTGGGIVPHGEDLTYTLVVPRNCEFFQLTALESYSRIHEAVASALRNSSNEIRLAPQAAPKISNACFENPAFADILAGDRKVAGAAQRRTRHGLLHQGSIQTNGCERERLAECLGSVFSARVHQRSVTEREISAAARLEEEKYGREEWLRRY